MEHPALPQYGFRLASRKNFQITLRDSILTGDPSGSKQYLLRYITPINPHGVKPGKVATDAPILEDKTEAQRREVTGL